jgi:hypothetical protein
MKIRSRPFTLAAAAAALLGGQAVLAQVAPRADREAKPRIVRAEVAERDLSDVTGKDALIATGDNGKTLYVFTPEDESIRAYSENGDRWGDPVPLTYFDSPKLPTLSRMDVGDDRVVFAGSEGVFVFDLDGRQVAAARLFRPTDAVFLSQGAWVVGLCNLPHPAGGDRFFARGSFGDEVPRLVVYDDDFEVEATGLLEEGGPGSPNRAVARQLRLAAAGDRIYAAEIASYRLFELSKNLKIRDVVEDEDLLFVDKPSSEGAAVEGLEAPELDSFGKDLATGDPRPEPRKPGGVVVNVQRVIADVAWAKFPSRLYLLLERSDAGELHGVDQIDFLAGEARRSQIHLPDGYADLKLKQIAVGRRHVWLRGYPEDTPLFRVDRSVLEQGTLHELRTTRGDSALPEGEPTAGSRD